MVVAIYKAIELMRSVATAELGACISQLRLVAHKAPDYSPIGFVTNYHMFTGEKTCGTKCIIGASAASPYLVNSTSTLSVAIYISIYLSIYLSIYVMDRLDISF